MKSRIFEKLMDHYMVITCSIFFSVERPLIFMERPLIFVEQPLIFVERLLVIVERPLIFMESLLVTTSHRHACAHHLAVDG